MGRRPKEFERDDEGKWVVSAKAKEVLPALVDLLLTSDRYLTAVNEIKKRFGKEGI